MALPQSLSAQVERYREDWRWTSYGPDAGLTGGPVARFLETPAGEIWAVTAGGIFRYDGFQWQAGTALGLPAGHATAAPLDTSESELLVVVAGRVFQGGAQGFTETSTIGTNPIPTDLDSLTALDNGDILLAISESGLIFRPSTDSLGPVISPRENARIAAGGGALFARVGVSLWFRADEDWVPVPAGTVDPPRAWVGSDEALFGFRSSARTTRGLWEWTRGSAPRQIPGQATRVAALTVGPGGDAIVTSTTGAVHLRVDGMWQEMGYPSSQLAEANALHYSTSGDLWTATHDIVHLYRSDDGLWSHPPIVGDLEVQSILVTRDGSVWVGTESGLTISRPNGRRETTGTIGGDSLQVISGLAEDSAGNVWVSSGATFRGIYRWNGDSWRHFGAADGFTNANVHRIIPGRDGRLWLMVLDNEVVDEGADRSGVWYYDASGFHRLATETGKALGRSYDMAEGSDGTLWFGTVTGLYRLAGNEWTSWTDADGLAFNRVFTVAVDGTGTPWFGHQSMGGGLGTVGPGDSVSYETTHDYLLSDEVHGIDVDAGGIVWFTTDRGVGRREDGVFTSFDRGTGLGHQLLWALTLAGDSIWVGSMGGGVFVLRPGNASGYPPVVAGHQPLISDNVAVQRWTPLSYKGEIPSDNILTRHRLAGETWSDWSTARRVFAYDLNPGEYAFSVQARDHFGNISDPIKLPVFTISPPIYRHPLVIGIVAVWLGSMIFIAIVFLRRRKAQLAEVTDRERHFRSLIENATDLITVLAEDGTVLYESPSSERLLGSPPEGLRGAAALQLIHDDDRPAVEAELARAFENPGTMHSMEFRFRHRDGRWIDLESIGRVNPEHASPRRIVLNSRDITLRKSAERAMEELQAELRHAHKMDALGTMAGGIAHDFNNILTAIMGYAEILRDSSDEKERARHDLDQILAATQRARDLVAQILTFSTRSEAAIRPIKPASVLNEVEKLLRAAIPSTIDIEVRAADDAGTINADPGQIHQVLMNLGTNAAHAMKDSGGKLTITLETTVVDAEIIRRVPGLEPGPHVRLTVADNGVGIPANVLPLIYDPFFTTKKVGEGTGLGLSVVHGIITKHGGRVVARSTPGKGTSFEIYLPCIKDVVVPPDEPRVQPVQGGAETILIVDDEPQIAAVSAAMLKNLGYRPHICGSSTEAAELLTRRDHGIALLLSDYTMPVMTGVELTEAIRLASVAIPVIIMTGYGQSIESESLDQLGVSSVLMKPFKMAELGNAVSSALQASSVSRERSVPPTGTSS